MVRLTRNYKKIYIFSIGKPGFPPYGCSKINLPLSYKQGQILKCTMSCTAAPFDLANEDLKIKLRGDWVIDGKHVNVDNDFNSLIKVDFGQ